MTEPDDFCGPIPVRTELTVLGPDDPSRPVLGLRMIERNGVPLHKSKEKGPDGGYAPLLSKDDLKPGDVVFCAWILGGFVEFTIAESEDGSLCGRSGGMLFFLSFAEDDRKCWTSWGSSNLGGVKKLEIKTEG